MFPVAIYSLGLLAYAMQWIIARRLLVRRFLRDYPLFLAYIVKHILSDPSLFFGFHFGSRIFYQHLYVGWEAVDVILKFGVIGELFVQVFNSYKSILEWGTTIVRGASVILVLVAVLASSLSNLADPNSFLSKFFAMERSAEIVQAGLLFLLFALCYVLGLHWRQPSLGIAFGLCITTSVFLVTFTLRTELGSSSNQILSLVSSVGYNLGNVVWLLALYLQDHTANKSVVRSTPSWDVTSWNRTLLELLRR